MAIRNTDIVSKLSEIATLIRDSKIWAGAQPGTSLDSHLATYIDVCLLGVLEESIEILFRERAERPGDQCTANYIRQDIAQSFQNPKFGKIRDVLYRFNPIFAQQFETRFPANSSEMTALRDINTVKQNIAHQGVYSLTLTLVDVEDYFNRVKPILEGIEIILT